MMGLCGGGAMMRRLVGPAVVAVIAVAVAVQDAPAQPGPSKEQIKQAWQRRQDAIKAVRVAWDEVITRPKSYYDLILDRRKVKKPTEDLRLTGKGMVAFDENNLYLRIERKNWSVAHGKVMDSEDISVYTRDRNVLLTVKSTVVDYLDAHISKKRKAGGVAECTLWPIACYARGTNPIFTPINLDDYQLTGNTPTVDGRRCVELATESRPGDSRYFVLLDTGRGFLLTRYYEATAGRVTTRLDVRYAPDSAHAWLPKSWDYTVSSSNGSLLESNQVTVASIEVNPPLPEGTFDLPLLPGTRVYDEYDGPAKQYVIRANGNAGPAIPDSAVPSYEQLTELAEGGGGWLKSGPMTVLAVVVVLATGAAIWRWRSRRTTRPE